MRQQHRQRWQKATLFASSESTYNAGVRNFTNMGLVRQVGNGVYMLSEEGQQYLDGELDAAELEPDDDE